MKKSLVIIFILLIIFSSVSLAEDLKQKWLDSKIYYEKTKIDWQEAQLLVAKENTPENTQNVIDKAKISLNAGLDSAVAFFEFKKDKLTNDDISDSLKDTIRNDLDKNIDTANGLKTYVNNIKTRVEVGLVSIKIFDKYLNLLVDVMRDSGLVFVEKSNDRYDKLVSLRDKVISAIPEDKKSEYKDLIDQIDNHLDEAKKDIDSAEAKYKTITQKQGSGIAFGEGNNLIMQANQNMLLAFENGKLMVMQLRGGA